MDQAGVASHHTRYGAITAELKREIRLIKEELFTQGSVTRKPADLTASAQLDDFNEYDRMKRLSEEIRRKFEDVLGRIDESWLKLGAGKLEVYFTGGGAELPMVSDLANNQPLQIGKSTITPTPVRRPPDWLAEECEDIVEFYPQLAVALGGACHTAERTVLRVESEFETFGGDLAGAQFTLERF